MFDLLGKRRELVTGTEKKTKKTKKTETIHFNFQNAWLPLLFMWQAYFWLQVYFFCYRLPFSWKIFLNVFSGYFARKPNSEKICEEIWDFPSQFLKNAVVSIFAQDSSLIISEKCMASLWILK